MRHNETRQNVDEIYIKIHYDVLHSLSKKAASVP